MGIAKGVTTTNISNLSDTSPTSTSETPPNRVRTLKDLYENCSFALTAADPLTYNEAIGKKEWQTVMEEEIIAIQKNSTWELVDLPEVKIQLV